MTPRRAIVVDDEPLARKRLARMLLEAGWELAGECGSVPQLLHLLECGAVADLLFLDIEMPGGTGLEAPPELPRPIPVIFVTAHLEHAARAFEVDAVDYLLKPVFRSRLQKALEKWERLHHRPEAPASATGPARSPSRFPAKAAGGTFFLDIRRVTHFEFQDFSVSAWLGGQKFRVGWESLGKVEEAFPDAGLLRIQRHILVRPDAILSIRSLAGGRAAIRLNDGPELEVSRSMTPKVRDVLGLRKGAAG